MAFTPKPLYAIKSPHWSNAAVIISEQPDADWSSGNEIARVYSKPYAQLFAAAPDLLAACEEFCRKVEAGEARSVRSYAQMHAALAKAKEGC